MMVKYHGRLGSPRSRDTESSNERGLRAYRWQTSTFHMSRFWRLDDRITVSDGHAGRVTLPFAHVYRRSGNVAFKPIVSPFLDGERRAWDRK